jgi:hypothetical protein
LPARALKWRQSPPSPHRLAPAPPFAGIASNRDERELEEDDVSGDDRDIETAMSEAAIEAELKPGGGNIR